MHWNFCILNKYSETDLHIYSICILEKIFLIFYNITIFFLHCKHIDIFWLTYIL